MPPAALEEDATTSAGPVPDMGGEKRNLVVSEDGSSGSLSKKPKEDTTVPAPACEPESSTTVVNGRTLRHRDREAVPPRMPRVQKPRSLPKWVTAGGRVEKGLNLTDVKLPVSEAEQQPDEGAALFDSRLTAMYEDMGGEAEDVPIHRLTEFTVFDSEGRLAPLDAGLIEKDHELFCCGVIKPVWDDADTPDGGPFCSRMGPITEWNVSGFDGGEGTVIGIATVYAEYKLLGNPSQEYSPFMISIREKALLVKVVIEHLQDHPESTFEEMLAALGDRRPEGVNTEPLSEESVLRHAVYLLDQIWDYDLAGEEAEEAKDAATEGAGDGEIKIFFSPAIQYLSKLEGYSLSARRRVRMGGNRARAPRKDIHRGMPATTTPLVSWVFDDFFMKGVAGVKRVGDDSWMQYLTGFDGLEVQCRGPEKEVNGVLRFPEGQQVPVVELADGHNAVSLAKFEKLAGCAAKKPRESIKFTASGLALSATAKEAGWKGTDSDLSASGAAAMDVEDDEEGADENHDKPKKSRTSADAARLARPSSTGSSKRILMEAGADEEVVCAQWEGEGELANGRTFYRSTKLGGQRLEIGDFCLALDEDGEECLFRVASMWEELLQKGSPSRRASASASRKGKAGAAAASKRTSTFLGHKYMFGADTVLGSAADGREVFMLDELMELPLSSITCKGMCAMLSTPSGWHELGGQPIEQCMQDIDALFADQEEAGKSEFFVRKVYEPEQGRFVDIPSSSALLPPHAFDRGSDFDALAFVESATCSLWQKEIPLCSVSICVEDLMQDAGLGLAEGHNLLTRAMELLGDLRATRVLGLPTALTLGKRKVQSYAQAQADGQHFALGDCVYLPSEAFDFRCSPPDEDPVWLKELEERRQDSGTYPELYRLKEGRRFKGSHDGTHPFRIGQVLRIYTVSGDVRLSVRKFYRPSDTREGEEFSSREHTHRLYWSHETATVDLDDVLGICRVVRLSNLHPGEDPWSIGDGLTKYKDTFFFTNCYDTQDRGSPAFTALPDADAPRSASGRNQGGRAGDETESDFDPDSGDECANESAFLSSFPTCFETLEAAAPAWVSKGKGKNSGATGACAPADSEHAHAPQPMACLDIFAGCGGLTEGLHAAGAVESKWAIEFEERAAEAFKLNFPGAETFTDDCNIILKQVMDGMEADNTGRRLPQKGEVQAMCGGPPCQGYSGMNRFNEGQYSRFKNSLVSTYLSYCDYYRPRFFLLENVKNFGHFKEGGVLKLCIRTLITMGYQVAFGCLQAANYGVPQSRRRMFIVACAPGEVLPKFPEPTHTFTRTGCQLTVTINDTPYCPLRRQGGPAPLKRTTVRDAIGDLPVVNLGESRTEMLYDGQSASDYQKLMRSSMPANKDGVVFDHVVKEMGAIHLARFQHIPTWAGADWRLLPNVQVTLRDGRRTSLLEYPEPSGKAAHGPAGHGGVGHEPQDTTLIPWCLPHTGNRHNHWAGLYGRLDWNGHFGTTVTNPEPMGKQGVVIHPEQHRIVSVRECARSQGFPDHFRFAGSISERYKQIGNAVPPPLARAIGQEWVLSLKEKAERESAATAN